MDGAHDGREAALLEQFAVLLSAINGQVELTCSNVIDSTCVSICASSALTRGAVKGYASSVCCCQLYSTKDAQLGII